uniref:hypothetical protein n=1 Tax=Altererythrobacter segetis TaxID=1104773 RepID=UPI00140CA358|nr:hypothetical protein [Altererythrobacter segetis]
MVISQGREIGAENTGSAVSLLFAAGRRPEAAAIRDFAQRHGGFAISFDPSVDRATATAPIDDQGQDWLELLASGLTFDLVGLRPGPPSEPPPCVHAYALAANAEAAGLEAITMRPGPHLAGGHTMLPVVRSLAWLAATLSEIEGVEAVAWQPARSWSGPAYFRGGVLRWIEGGVFPGLGLTALAVTPDGGMQSEGLSLFAGQDLRIEPELMLDKAEGAKIGVRLIDFLVEAGPIDAPQRVTGPDGQALRLEPSANGRFIRVWRG